MLIVRVRSVLLSIVCTIQTDNVVDTGIYKICAYERIILLFRERISVFRYRLVYLGLENENENTAAVPVPGTVRTRDLPCPARW